MIDGQKELQRGLWWLGSATVLMRVIDIAATLVVLQLIGAEQVGLASVPFSVLTVLEALTGFGVGQALVQAQTLSRRETDGLFWFATGLGVAMAVLLCGAAPMIAHVYGDARLTPLLVVSAAKLVFVALAFLPGQLLVRELKFAQSSATQTIASVLESATKIVLAMMGAGAWALIVAATARGLFLLIALYAVAPYWPRLHFAWAEVKRFVSFGSRVIASTTLFHFYRNADYLLIGKFLGMEALGIYRVAFDIALGPQEVLFNVVNRAAYPVYARLASDANALVTAFFRSARYFVVAMGPICVGIFFLSPDVIPLLASGRWIPAVPLIQVLVCAALPRGLALLFPQVFQASGKPGLAIVDSVITMVTLVSGFLLALTVFDGGASGVAWTWVLAYPLIVVSQLVLVQRAVVIAPLRYLQNLGGPVLGVAIMAMAMFALTRFPLASGPWGSVIAAAVGLAGYFTYVRFALPGVSSVAPPPSA